MTAMEELSDLDKATAPRIMGVDPSITATGIALPDGTTKTIVYPKTVVGDWRLNYIHDIVQMEIEDAAVSHVVIEDLPTHAHGAGILGMVQGVVRLAALGVRVPYITVTPATLKKLATGHGTATKSDMRVEHLKRTGSDIRSEDEVDAWWLRELGLQLLGQGTLKLPETHRAALKTVKGW